MKTMSNVELTVRILIILPAVISAAILAYKEKEGWGWLIFIAVLAML